MKPVPQFDTKIIKLSCAMKDKFRHNCEVNQRLDELDSLYCLGCPTKLNHSLMYTLFEVK